MKRLCYYDFKFKYEVTETAVITSIQFSVKVDVQINVFSAVRRSISSPRARQMLIEILISNWNGSGS